MQLKWPNSPRLYASMPGTHGRQKRSPLAGEFLQRTLRRKFFAACSDVRIWLMGWAYDLAS